MAEVIVRRADTPGDRQACYAIRAAVFAREQGVQGAERGDRDDATAIHALGLVNGVPAGTGRLHAVQTRTGPEGQIAWVSVLPQFRRAGVGTAVMRHLMDAARDLGLPRVVLNAQTYAKGLYEQFGFEPVGAPFVMANIEHQLMVVHLSSRGTAPPR
jgi:predicted GNAT family N-acyltransferase